MWFEVMPTFRKVSQEDAKAWASAPAIRSRAADDRYTWVERPAMIFLSGKPRPLSTIPRVGDVVRLRATAGSPPEQSIGIVFDVRTRQDGIWTHVQIAINNTIIWTSKSTIAAHLGGLKELPALISPPKCSTIACMAVLMVGLSVYMKANRLTWRAHSAI